MEPEHLRVSLLLVLLLLSLLSRYLFLFLEIDTVESESLI
jgi:hypothetical protein